MRKALAAIAVLALGYAGIGVWRYATFLDRGGYCFADTSYEAEVCTGVCQPGKGCTSVVPGQTAGCATRELACKSWPRTVKGPEEQFRHAHQLLLWPLALIEAE